MHDDIDESITNNENKLFNNLNLQNIYLKTYILYNKTPTIIVGVIQEQLKTINSLNTIITFLFVVESLKFFIIPPVSDL